MLVVPGEDVGRPILGASVAELPPWPLVMIGMGLVRFTALFGRVSPRNMEIKGYSRDLMMVKNVG